MVTLNGFAVRIPCVTEMGAEVVTEGNILTIVLISQSLCSQDYQYVIDCGHLGRIFSSIEMNPQSASSNSYTNYIQSSTMPKRAIYTLAMTLKRISSVNIWLLLISPKKAISEISS